MKNIIHKEIPPPKSDGETPKGDTPINNQKV